MGTACSQISAWTVTRRQRFSAPIGQAAGFVFEFKSMTRWFFYFFYFFPCHLAEGTG